MSQAEYMRNYRATEAGKVAKDRQKKREKARLRAMRRLASIHWAEFQDVLNEELREVGL